MWSSSMFAHSVIKLLLLDARVGLMASPEQDPLRYAALWNVLGRSQFPIKEQKTQMGG
jgi:hypothetical protein